MRFKKLLSFAAACAMAVTATLGAVTASADDSVWTVDASDPSVLTGYTGTETDLVLPTEINGTKITSIAASAFQGNTTITSVVVPEGYTSIGDSAFRSGSSLISISLPSTLETLGKQVFRSDSSLKKINIPEKITEIPDYTFSNCNNPYLIVDVESTSIATIGRNPLGSICGVINVHSQEMQDLFSAKATGAVVLLNADLDSIKFKTTDGFLNYAYRNTSYDVTLADDYIENMQAADTTELVCPAVFSDGVHQELEVLLSFDTSRTDSYITSIVFNGSPDKAGNEIFKGFSALKKVIFARDELNVNFNRASFSRSTAQVEEVYLYAKSVSSFCWDFLDGLPLNTVKIYVTSEEIKQQLISATTVQSSTSYPLADPDNQIIVMSSGDDKPTPDVNLTCESVDYGHSFNPQATVTLNSQPITDAEIEYNYFSDAECKNKVTFNTNPPVGTYYARATVYGTDDYNIAYSNVVEVQVREVILDKTALDTALTNAASYKVADYTPNSYTALTRAVSNGKNVKENAKTQIEIDEATSQINDAIEGLKSAPDREHTSAWITALNKYRNISATNYTDESYAQYKAVLDKMLEMNSKQIENCTNEEIDTMISEIEAAYNKLELKIVLDYTELETAIANAKKITDDETSVDKYMPKSYQYLLTQLKEGEAIIADKNSETYTQSDINQAEYGINYAIEHLEAADKAELYSTLQDTIKKAEALDTDKYTADSFAPLTEALKTAKSVSSESSLADIISAQETLDSALEGLIFSQTIVPAGEPFGYIRHGWTSTPFLKGVIDESMTGATQIKLTFDCADDTSYNSYFSTPIEAKIGETVTNFEMKASTTAENLGEKNCTAVMTLTSPVVAGQSYTLTGYTYGYASAKDYVFAITKIEFMDDSGYILGTVTDKTIAKDDLAKAIADAEAIDTAKYTDDSVKAVKDAIEAAKALTDEATVSEINEATDAIENAVKGLVKKPTEPDPSKPDPSKPDPKKPEPSKPTTASTNATRNAKQVAKDKQAAKKAMKQAKITKLKAKSKAKKKLNVTWKKVKKAKGYQVQVSAKKNFKKVIFKKDLKKTKLTIKNKKIKSKKTYYVRVRAYATYKDKNNKTVKVYSKWNKKLRKVFVK